MFCAKNIMIITNTENMIKICQLLLRMKLVKRNSGKVVVVVVVRNSGKVVVSIRYLRPDFISYRREEVVKIVGYNNWIRGTRINRN